MSVYGIIGVKLGPETVMLSVIVLTTFTFCGEVSGAILTGPKTDTGQLYSKQNNFSNV